MKGVIYKYGLVIGIFTSVVVFLIAWGSYEVAAGLLPYAIAFGVTFGLTLFYNISRKKELKDTESIPYHEAFINSFVMAFIGLAIFSTSFTLIKGVAFKEIPQISKKKTLERYNEGIKIYTEKLKKDGSEAAEMIATLKQQKTIVEKQEFDPMHKDNIGNSILSVFLMAGVIGAFISIVTAFFGFRIKPISTE